MQYSLLYTRANKIDNQSYLYLTPLLMIDGRVPMVGSNGDAPAKARAAIRESLNTPAPVALVARFAEPAGTPRNPASDRTRELKVNLRAQSPALAGQEVLVQVVTIEDGLSTQVAAGELKGETYRARFTARDFAFESMALTQGAAGEARFPIKLAPEGKPENTSVVVLVQDEATGQILQARRITWPTPTASPSESKHRADDPTTKRPDSGNP